MSLYLNGVTFEDCFIRPQEDAALMAAICADGLYGGCQITASGATVKLSAGRIIACGRICIVASELSVPVSGTSGYARLVLTIDRSKSAAQQRAIDVETSTTLEGFAALTQNDINAGESVYQMVLCTVSLGTSGVTGIISTCGAAHGKAAGVLVSLPVSGWSGNRQTVRCDGATADNLIEASGAPESLDAYWAADVRLVGQSAGKITFSCASVPSADLQVNVRLS